MKLEVQRTGPGLGAVETIMRELDDATLAVGVVGPKARARHRDRDGSPGDLTVAELAAVHEFGVNVPERSFIRATVATELRAMRARYGHHAKRMLAGEISVEDLLKIVGDPVAETMKRRLLHGIKPDLAESTRRDPGRDPRGLPLVDTEQILDAVGVEIEL